MSVEFLRRLCCKVVISIFGDEGNSLEMNEHRQEMYFGGFFSGSAVKYT